MNILYIGNFNSPVAEYIAKSFEELGHYVKRRHEDFTTVDWALDNLKGYNFVLCEEARMKGDYVYGDWEKKQLDRVGGRFKEVMDKILVVPWLTNLIQAIPERKHLLEENPIFKAPRVFTTDGGLKGKNMECLRQGIYQKEALMTGNGGLINFKVGFVGENNQRFWPYREKLIEFLQGTFKNDFRWVGQGSANGVFTGLELNAFCASIKIMIGDSVYSPDYWSNRVYEMIGRGAFLIMPNIPGLDKEFIPFKHYIPYEFNNFDDLLDKISHYLTHAKERELIRKEGFEYCKENYTYKHRVKVILDYVQKSRNAKS